MQKTFNVPGIMCEGCAGSIKRALGRLQGVELVEVDVAGKLVDVRFNADTTEDAIAQKIEAAGYTVEK